VTQCRKQEKFGSTANLVENKILTDILSTSTNSAHRLTGQTRLGVKYRKKSSSTKLAVEPFIMTLQNSH